MMFLVYHVYITILWFKFVDSSITSVTFGKYRWSGNALSSDHVASDKKKDDKNEPNTSADTSNNNISKSIDAATVVEAISTSKEVFLSKLSSPPNSSTPSCTTQPGKINSNRQYIISTHSIQGKRNHMEDEYFVNSGKHDTFVSVMDGHGGNAVSKYVKQNLYARLLQSQSQQIQTFSLSEKFTDPNTKTDSFLNVQNQKVIPASVIARMYALRSAFRTVDAEVQKISHWSFQGSTALAVLLHQTKVRHPSYLEGVDAHEKTVLLSANVGDSRAVLCRDALAIQLTRDHKPNDPIERRRVEKVGGKVNRVHGVYRINGNLSLSRAIGDRSERPAVNADVDIQQLELDEEKDEFVILATDGVFDVFSNQDLVDFIRDVMNSPTTRWNSIDASDGKFSISDTKGTQESGIVTQKDETVKISELHESVMKTRRKLMAQYVVEEALRRGSMDNISTVIVWLKE